MDKKRKPRQKNTKANQIPGFLSKTYKILENEEFKDIITWNDDGTSFKVLKLNEFSEKILPQFFKHNVFSSFVRQLNMYDFHKISKHHDTDENEWKHVNFKRGHPELLAQIKRKGSENQQYPKIIDETSQLQVVQNQEPIQNNEVAIYRKELDNLHKKVDFQERAIQLLLTQTSKYIQVNKYMWQEIKQNRKQSQLMQFALTQLLSQGRGNFKIPKNFFNLLGKDDDIQFTNDNDLFNENQNKGSQNNNNVLMKHQSQKEQQNSMKKIMKQLMKNLNNSNQLKEDSSQDQAVNKFLQNNSDLFKNLAILVNENKQENQSQFPRQNTDQKQSNFNYETQLDQFEYDNNNFQNQLSAFQNSNNNENEQNLFKSSNQNKNNHNNNDFSFLDQLKNNNDLSDMQLNLFQKDNLNNNKNQPLMITEKANSQMSDCALALKDRKQSSRNSQQNQYFNKNDNFNKQNIQIYDNSERKRVKLNKEQSNNRNNSDNQLKQLIKQEKPCDSKDMFQAIQNLNQNKQAFNLQNNQIQNANNLYSNQKIFQVKTEPCQAHNDSLNLDNFNREFEKNSQNDLLNNHNNTPFKDNSMIEDMHDYEMDTGNDHIIQTPFLLSKNPSIIQQNNDEDLPLRQNTISHQLDFLGNLNNINKKNYDKQNSPNNNHDCQEQNDNNSNQYPSKINYQNDANNHNINNNISNIHHHHHQHHHNNNNQHNNYEEQTQNGQQNEMEIKQNQQQQQQQQQQSQDHDDNINKFFLNDQQDDKESNFLNNSFY